MVLRSSGRSPVFNLMHTPADLEKVLSADGENTFLSAVIKTPFPFSSLVLSANYRSPAEEGSVLLEAQVCVADKWSDFYKLGLLSRKQAVSFSGQQNSFGRVETDELALTSPAEAYRLRLKCTAGAEVSFIAVAGVYSPFEYGAQEASRLPVYPFEKEVFPQSQMEILHPDCRRICSPVSLWMALNALGVKTPLEEMIRGVFDSYSNMYGNWLFNTAYAGGLGTEAYVRRFGALAELEDFITPKSLVIASIAYEPGELTGAAIERTTGHLVVVCGWKEGKILAADPAAPNQQTVLRMYDAHEFANAWLNHKKGAAYIVRRT